MGHSVRITARALREIDEALAFLSARSRAAADQWHQQLLDAVCSLQNNPERCGPAPESEWYPGELRQLIHGKKRGVYRILFEVRGDTVYILRVRHSAQALLDPGEM
jgi:plasmid stabilization system protein ParE